MKLKNYGWWLGLALAGSAWIVLIQSSSAVNAPGAMTMASATRADQRIVADDSSNNRMPTVKLARYAQ